MFSFFSLCYRRIISDRLHLYMQPICQVKEHNDIKHLSFCLLNVCVYVLYDRLNVVQCLTLTILYIY